LTESEKRILNWVAEHEKVTISDVNKLLDLSWTKAKDLLLELARKRILQYVRFRPYRKDTRDSKAYFRLRSAQPMPDGSFEQEINGNSN
jgi:Mn-dependent DtxR family transcriptional regulator